MSSLKENKLESEIIKAECSNLKNFWLRVENSNNVKLKDFLFYKSLLCISEMSTDIYRLERRIRENERK